MTRILHVIDTTGPGGAETVFVELADRIRGHGFESLTLVNGPGWVMDSLKQRRIETQVMPARGSLNWRYLLGLRGLINRESIDLVQSHLLGSNIYCAAAGWLAHRPVVATFHGAVDIARDERFRSIKVGLMNRGVREFVAVSDSLASLIKGEGISPAHPVNVIYNGVDLSRYQRSRHRRLTDEFGLRQDAILVGSLGNVRPAKAYDVLIRAAATVCSKDPRVHFLIAGHIKDSIAAPLRALVAELSLEQRVRFLGFREDTPGFLAGLEIFALSSASEGFSVATVEAQAAGLPIVATRCGGPEEIVVDGETGLLVPTGDPIALGDAIASLIHDPILAARLGRQAREAAHARFSIDSMIHQYANIYRRLTCHWAT